jgi:frataxin-like iron-binding protein CyaY
MRNDDNEFRQHTQEALRALRRLLAPAGDDFGFEVNLEAGVLEIEFDAPQAPITLTLHSAQEQVWLVSGARTHKLTWDIVENSFVLEATGQTLQELLEGAISEAVGEDVTF